MSWMSKLGRAGSPNPPHLGLGVSLLNEAACGEAALPSLKWGIEQDSVRAVRACFAKATQPGDNGPYRGSVSKRLPYKGNPTKSLG